MVKKRKGQTDGVVWEDTPDAQAAELEHFLFNGAATGAFDIDAAAAEAAGVSEEALRRKKAHRGGAAEGDDELLFFEDAEPGEELLFSDEDDEDLDEGVSGEEEEGGEEEGEESDVHGESDDAEAQPSTSARRGAGGRGASVWTDPDDETRVVDLSKSARLHKLRQDNAPGSSVVSAAECEAALRKRHAMLNPRTAWERPKAAGTSSRAKSAAADGDTSDEDLHEAGMHGSGMDALGSHAHNILGEERRGRAARLPAGSLEVSRLGDANQHDPHSSVVSCVEFHPGGQLLLTGGLDKRLRLFRVDGVRNPRVQSVFLEDTPVVSAAFASGGSHIIASGRRPHFYMYDLEAGQLERVAGPRGVPNGLASCEGLAVSRGDVGASGPMAAFPGDQGYLPLLSLKSRQWIGNLKMSGSVRSAAFAPDGNTLLTSGSDGLVYTWDLRMRRCIAQMVDHGNQGSGTLALSPNGAHLATGAGSGIVNLYSRDASVGTFGGGVASAAGWLLRPTAPDPLRQVSNLTTPIDSLAFNHDGQILALASRMKKDSMRLLHVPSRTVFANWPTSRSPLHFVHSVAFSPSSSFLAVGNARGRVLLYRLHHYVDV